MSGADYLSNREQEQKQMELQRANRLYANHRTRQVQRQHNGPPNNCFFSIYKFHFFLFENILSHFQNLNPLKPRRCAFKPETRSER